MKWRLLLAFSGLLAVVLLALGVPLVGHLRDVESERLRAALDQFPVFGREGHALPLGRAVQHTGDIDATNPLDQLWLFGAPANSLDGFTQARIEADGDGGFTLRTGTGLEVVRFEGA